MERLYGIAGTTRTWYTSDPLGSVRATLSDTGVVGGIANYDPWGQLQSGSVGMFGFTGELQQGSNLYLRARWYTASYGTFASREPWSGDPQRPNTLMYYGYAGGNPISNIDPTGKCYGMLEWMRNVEAEQCHNLDKAVVIWHSDQANFVEKGIAYSYAFAFYVGHAAIVAAAIPQSVGVPIVAGTKAAATGVIAGVEWLLVAGMTRVQSCQQNAQTSVQQSTTIAQRGQLVINEGAELLDDEAVIVNQLLTEGKNIIVQRSAGSQGINDVRTADLIVNGIRTELKTVSNLKGTTPDFLSKGLSSRIMDGVGQASNIVVNTTKQAGMTREIAERGVWRAFGSANIQNLRLESVRIIGQGFDIILQNDRMPANIQ